MNGLHSFAIGDIHGRADLLTLLLDAIKKRASDMEIEYRVIFLGDIIDRGPDSAGAMHLVSEALAENPLSQLILGNHDWFPIRILDELSGDDPKKALNHWVTRLGGDATLISYGFDPDKFCVDDLRLHFPGEHLKMLRGAKSFVETEAHVFVHAGILPGVPLADQTRHDLMWIREPFLSYRGRFEKTVVHGHTPNVSNLCETAPGRVGVDTGAYATGCLSAAHVFPSNQVLFMGTVPSFDNRVDDHPAVLLS